MTAPWTLRLPRECADALSWLYAVPELRVCEFGDDIWVRGESLTESLELMLRGMAGGDFFWIEADCEQLRAREARVPTARLPCGEWQPLARVLRPERPDSVWPGELVDSAPRVPLRLVVTDDVLEPNLLLTSQADWAEYAVAAPQVRLDRWRFALADDGRVLIRGLPLPPLPGEQFVERDGIAVRIGWAWTPPVEAAVVHDVFGLGDRDIALWESSELWEIVRGEQFVGATRSGVRSSKPEGSTC